eukprot:14224547-Alexandrium_andersonii.AAC.1
MLVSAAIRLNSQSAMRNMQHRVKPSNLGLHGPKSGLEIGPSSSRGVRSALFLAQSPTPPTKWVIEG